MKLRISRLLAIAGFAIVAVAPGQLRAANLTTLFSFNGSDGGNPKNLIADANGNLFGASTQGGPINQGTVFEVPKTAAGYASTPTTLAVFNNINIDGAFPVAGLIADANGNLFGATEEGGAYGLGTVFEIVKTASGYASTPIVLVSFNGTDGAEPFSGPIADANGNLFGTTYEGGAYGLGTVFEIVKTAAGYANTPTVLVSFNGTDGANPDGSLIADANGNLLGVTAYGGPYGIGTVFEIAKTASGYANTPITLVSLGLPYGGPIADANGNLFGTTAGGYSTLFEIVKTAAGYASTATTLASIDGTDDSNPSGLIADANGNFFGTTSNGGTGYGTVFEIVKTASGYTPTTLISFNGTDGEVPGALIADANGNLLGTTAAGRVYGEGTVFEITGSGFVPPVIFAGTPGKSNCHGQSISALARHYGGLNGAAAALGYADVSALQSAILTFCEG